MSFFILCEILANKGIIDSFITSQPSRMLKTFMNLSQNDLLKQKVKLLKKKIELLEKGK